ncbi:hypothetical protein DFJ58DRAFT_850202 [Suillus subalutaceus]|uniref:uncharacterized protein n=1 Tax=Suillus subalutaceus TaxID=48586 RepID=UPI001B878531|nr:uncharacterized protein DFJ58DRAFT_850202 [Suillus subalutaceus]KAG1819395.1 hypothetical protein DFJ58DRAFT_850202 [Suillus subalutaceus]
MLRAIAILLGQADHEQKAKKIAETTSFHMVGAIERLEKAADDHEGKITALDSFVIEGRSYANVAQARQPKPDSSILARSEAQARQILVGRKSMSEISGLKDLTEAELVRKAKQALEGMKEGGLDVPQDASFTCARKLRHGGVIFETDSIETKAWLSCQSASQAFSEHFGSETMIKDRTL